LAFIYLFFLNYNLTKNPAVGYIIYTYFILIIVNIVKEKLTVIFTLPTWRRVMRLENPAITHCPLASTDYKIIPKLNTILTMFLKKFKIFEKL